MLIDTNIIIEVGKKQEQSKSCRDFITAIDKQLIEEEIYLTGFSLNAIQAILSEVDTDLVRDILLLVHQEKIKIFNFKPENNLLILAALTDLSLDFDDATQYIAANQLGTTLVTFDKDFKKTGIKTTTPDKILKKILI